MILVVSAFAYVGCGKSTSPTTVSHSTPSPVTQESSVTGKVAANPSNTPDEMIVQVTRDFLTSMLQGNDEKLRSLLTPLARKKGQELGIPFSPPASDTATFTIDDVAMQGDQGAYVFSTLTDKNPRGVNESAEIIWVVAKTNEGWRIAGAAVSLFDGVAKTIINFEDPEAAKKAIADAELKATRGVKEASTMPKVQ